MHVLATTTPMLRSRAAMEGRWSVNADRNASTETTATTTTTESTILQRVAAGDAGAVRECVSHYTGLLWSLTRYFGVPRSDAEDLMQEIFVDVWRSADRFDPTRSAESSYVTMIARRRLIDWRRKSGRRHAKLGHRHPLWGDETVLEDCFRDIDQRDDAVRARRAVATLPEGQRRVLLLALAYGMTHQQIADHTGLPLGTVKTHARRGLLRLRERLGVEVVDGEIEETGGAS